MLIHGFVILAPSLPHCSPRTVPLGSEWSAIGRMSSNDIVLEHASISRTHTRVRSADGRVIVEDLGSANGTHVRRADGTEDRLTAHREHRLGEGESLRLGPFLLIPGESAGDGVVLTDGSLHEPPENCDPAALTSTSSSLETVSAPEEAEALARALQRPYHGDPWSWVLEGLRELADWRRAFVFARVGERLGLRASAGVDGPVCVSQRFLSLTEDSRIPWTLVTGAAHPPEASSPSLREMGPAVRLTGVPFRGADETVVAVAYLEGAPDPGPDLDALAGFARVTVPLLQLAVALDRETRRREAAEATAGARATGERRSSGERSRAGLVGRSPAFLAALETIERAATTQSTVLIRGPSGSGKDGLARLLHDASERKDHPFYALNAAALPENLVESALFGHDRGAFTGAERKAPGAFEIADGGTLFLDEVGDLSLAAQAKILRAIETGEITRVGGTQRRVDVRVVAATHRDLERMVEEGSFRRDLFYRVRVIEVSLPALSERPEDILELAQYFLREYRTRDGKRMSGPSPAAARALTRYSWPGNIRELRNVVERASVLDRDGLLDVDDLPPEVTGSDDGHAGGTGSALFQLAWPEARKRFERDYFARALEHHGGKVAETAESTGVDRRTVSAKIREHDLKPRS